MSAREDALREMTHGHLYLDDERAGALLDAYRAETLREAAAKIRSAGRTYRDAYGPYRTAVGMAYEFAHLIDPDAP